MDKNTKIKIWNYAIASIILLFAAACLYAVMLPGYLHGQRAHFENNCLKMLSGLIEDQNGKPKTSNDTEDAVIDYSISNIVSALNQENYIHHYHLSMCINGKPFTYLEDRTSMVQSFTIIAFPNRIDESRTYLSLRTFAINHVGELFVKLDEPQEITCENIRLHSADEWREIVTE